MALSWKPHSKSLTLSIWILALITFWKFGLSIIPAKPIDPWELFSLRWLIQMVIVLLLLQATAQLFANKLNITAGTFLTGFVGGFISSTAITGQISRASQLPQAKESALILIFSASTLAMLVETLVILSVGTSISEPRLFIVCAGPLILTLLQISHFWNRLENESTKITTNDPSSLSNVARLFGLLLIILVLSRISMNYLGKSGVYTVTLVASLFEMHASVIANTDLWANGALTNADLGDLIAISLMASLVSKLVLIFTLAKRDFSLVVIRWTGAAAVMLLASWATFRLTL